MLHVNEQAQYCCSPFWLITKQTNEERADALHRPPAILPSHSFSVALNSRYCWWWLSTSFLNGLFFLWPLNGLDSLSCWCRPTLRSCYFPRRSLCSWLGEWRWWEDHLRVIRCLPAHVRFNLSWCLAGIVQLSQVPHHLHEIVSRIFVVRGAGVRLAYVVTPVQALVPLAWQSQPREFPLTGDNHGAWVFSLGAEFDRWIPNASTPFSLSLSWPETAGEQQSSGLGPHSFQWVLNVKLLEMSVPPAFYWPSKEGIQVPKKKKKKTTQ